MASTYSALKIELIATGEQSGTWGTTTNNNLGNDALGEAITGSADVAFSSADVTVTLTDSNASQTARNLRLNLTGTSGGARQLILGAGCQIEKLYLVNNTLADAVTVKNTSGTGIAVAAGKSMFVYNNGTNVVEAVTQFNGTIALASGVSGVLPIANGGTGTSSTTFTNLTTNVTGTLPIANGGTGSTSTTFVNAATNITGTLPIANGGTGSTSTTFVNAATNVTGTLPIANGGTGSTSTTFVNAATNVTGTLPIANGGTGLTALGTANQVLAVNAGATALEFQSAASGYAGSSSSIYSSPGTFVVPTGITKVKVTVIGAGGGGAGNNSNSTNTSGGAGGLNIQYFTGLTPGASITVTVGTGGSGGGAGSPGSPGGSSSFGPAGPVGTITSTGGGGGNIGTGGGAGGAGGNYGITTSGSGRPGLGNVAGGYFLGNAANMNSTGYFLYGHLGGNSAGVNGGGGNAASYPGSGGSGGNGLVIVEY